VKQIFLVLSILIVSSATWAQKLSFDAGFFSVNAKPPSGSGTSSVSLSGPGSFSLSASFSLLPQIELSPGYTVFFSKIYRGDLGLGPDFSLRYFPVNAGSGLKIDHYGLKYFEIDSIRPFVGLSFHQRQFQSVQSSYSGFGFDAGSEFQITQKYSYRILLRMMNLIGPSEGSINYMDVLIGYQIHY